MTTQLDTRHTIMFVDAKESEFERLGGKCASLARMIAAGVTVPGGFAVTTDAYACHLANNTVGAEIGKIIETIDTKDVTDEEIKSAKARKILVDADMPAEVEQAIRTAYTALSPDGDLPVAVRSSATAEDMPDASFAGQQDTFLWVVGIDDILQKTKECWASLFNARAISYRHDHNLGHMDVLMSVGVQRMVDAVAAGVAMTLDPITGDRTRITIDSAFGLGEPVVSGEITPDNFVVEKILMEIIERRIVEKDFELVADHKAKTTVERVIEPERRTLPSLTDSQIMQVATLSKRLEKQMGCPQDVEWAVVHGMPEGADVVALQSRPETVWSQKKATKSTASYSVGMQSLVGTLMAPIANKD